MSAGTTGTASALSVECWVDFLRRPGPGRWYRAHNASVVAGYLEHEDLAATEGQAERFIMNVALLRVLFTHTMLVRPRLALGRLAVLGPLAADPRHRAVHMAPARHRPRYRHAPALGTVTSDRRPPRTAPVAGAAGLGHEPREDAPVRLTA